MANVSRPIRTSTDTPRSRAVRTAHTTRRLPEQPDGSAASPPSRSPLRIFQRRFKEALKVLDRSRAIFEQRGNRRRHVEQLMHKAAAAIYASWSEMAISDLTVALDIVEALQDEDLRVQVTISLGSVLVKAGQPERSTVVVKALDRQLVEFVNPLFLHQLQTVEGDAEYALGNVALAEEKYLKARTGFEALNKPYYTAFVELELAILYCETGRTADAVPAATATLHFFEALTLRREFLVSLGLLKDALRSRTVSEIVLQEVRSALQADPLVTLSEMPGPGPQAPAPSSCQASNR